MGSYPKVGHDITYCFEMSLYVKGHVIALSLKYRE